MKTTLILMISIWSFVQGLPNAVAADMIAKPLTQVRSAAGSTAGKKCSELSSEDATRLGLIQQMLVEGKPHAAIAHLDATGIKSDYTELLRSDALRQSGRELQAQVIYQQLVNSCVSGYAHRGLGLIASNTGHLQEALLQLKSASEALPTDHSIRNDYGYVLMQSGEYELALHEFLTAVELAPNYQQAAHNLILLLYKQGNATKAASFAKQFGITTEEVQQLKKIALESNGTTP